MGRPTVSNSPLFFRSHTKKLITSDDFYVDEMLPAGPAFDISYAGGMHTSSYSDMNVYLKPPTYKHGQEVTDKNKYFPSWLRHEAPVTMKLPSSQKYQHLQILKLNDQFFFRPGLSEKNHLVLLEILANNAVILIRDLVLIKGHPSFQKIKGWIQSRYLGELIARHISAHNLSSHDVPTQLQYKLMKQSDRDTWNEAYGEEYYGLRDLHSKRDSHNYCVNIAKCQS